MKKLFTFLLLMLTSLVLVTGCGSDDDIPEHIAKSNTMYVLADEQFHLQRKYLKKYSDPSAQYTFGELKKDLKEYRDKMVENLNKVKKIEYVNNEDKRKESYVTGVKYQAIDVLERRINNLETKINMEKSSDDNEICPFNVFFNFTDYVNEFYLKKCHAEASGGQLYISRFKNCSGPVLSNSLGVAPMYVNTSYQNTVDVGIALKNFDKKPIDLSTLQIKLIVNDVEYLPQTVPSDDVINLSDRYSPFGVLNRFDTFNPQGEIAVYESFVVPNFYYRGNDMLTDVEIFLNSKQLCRIPVIPLQPY